MLQILTTDDSRWLDFVRSRSEAHIFHHPNWAINLAQVYRYRGFVLALLGDKGKIRAGLPVMEVNSPLTGKRWVSMPFSDHCAPLYEDETALEELTDGLLVLSREENTPRIELRWAYPQRPQT